MHEYLEIRKDSKYSEIIPSYDLNKIFTVIPGMKQLGNNKISLAIEFGNNIIFECVTCDENGNYSFDKNEFKTINLIEVYLPKKYEEKKLIENMIFISKKLSWEVYDNELCCVIIKDGHPTTAST